MYALLLSPSANRVYADATAAMATAELGVLAGAELPGSGRIGEIGTELIGGVPYLVFEADRMDAETIAVLARLSAAYALFERQGALLAPLELRRPHRFDDDLITIPKYTGKTNEQFTRLLLNVTAFSARPTSDSPWSGQRFRVFDPLCGRGTTMHQAIMYGWNSAGMDVDGKDFDAYRAHLESWTRRKRLKHRTEVIPVRREKKLIGRRLELDLAPSKEEFKRGETVNATMVHADTLRAGDFFRPRTFDLLVTDLPYGVRHGSRSGDGSGGSAPAGSRPGSGSESGAGLSRRPLELLRRALPAWIPLLRPGGALGLSWNTYVAERATVIEQLQRAGLRVLEGGPYEQFAHRVDQAIHRDLVVARLD